MPSDEQRRRLEADALKKKHEAERAADRAKRAKEGGGDCDCRSALEAAGVEISDREAVILGALITRRQVRPWELRMLGRLGAQLGAAS